ncbi:hypothetical protein HDE76_002091 [Rhodanobacter sp. ANJX3]|uniref:hypothetical protein n=1 Tax=Rhodanobacter sp. ANJX3 TaxID=2723083 RepID=UPI0017A79CAF|nr:hypothetical protein [Rhodanobacter sp. ANJX3]MBB5358875.1 hypothetical protein [Rhodanobacter sp. ANJX3]
MVYAAVALADTEGDVVAEEATSVVEAEDLCAGIMPMEIFEARRFIVDAREEDAEVSLDAVPASPTALLATVCTGAALAWLVSYLAMSDCRSSNLASPLD